VKKPSFDQWMYGAAATCVLATAVEMLWPHPLRGASSDADAAAASTNAPPQGPLALTTDYVVEIERPLFTVDRRPYVVPPNAQAATAAAPAAPELNAQLIAVVRAGGDQMVLLRFGQAVRKLHSGETIDGWTVTKIDGSSVAVSNGSFQRTLDLKPAAVAQR
jgi:hypothetical protein